LKFLEVLFSCSFFLSGLISLTRCTAGASSNTNLLLDIPDEKFFVTLMGMKKGRKEVNLARVWRLHLLMRDILESAMLS